MSSYFYEARSGGTRSTGRSSIDSCNNVIVTNHTQVPKKTSKFNKLIRRQTTPANIGQENYENSLNNTSNVRPNFLNLNKSSEEEIEEEETVEEELNSSFRSVLRNGQIFLVSEENS